MIMTRAVRPEREANATAFGHDPEAQADAGDDEYVKRCDLLRTQLGRWSWRYCPLLNVVYIYLVDGPMTFDMIERQLATISIVTALMLSLILPLAEHMNGERGIDELFGWKPDHERHYTGLWVSLGVATRFGRYRFSELYIWDIGFATAVLGSSLITSALLYILLSSFDPKVVDHPVTGAVVRFWIKIPMTLAMTSMVVGFVVATYSIQLYLYLVTPDTHPDGASTDANEEDVYKNLYQQVDTCFAICFHVGWATPIVFVSIAVIHLNVKLLKLLQQGQFPKELLPVQ